MSVISIPESYHISAHMHCNVVDTWQMDVIYCSVDLSMGAVIWGFEIQDGGMTRQG